MRLGLLGGSFDPVHLGHLLMAQVVVEQLRLDEVRFVPAGQPWMKRSGTLAASNHRRDMVEMAVRVHPQFTLCSLELDREGDTFTVDTLEQVRAEWGPHDDLFFIMGADTLESFHRWKEPQRVLSLATVVVVMRPGHGEPELEAAKRRVPGAQEAMVVVRSQLSDISATDIRDRVAHDLPIRHLVPEGVAEYIEAHGLYRPQGP